MYVGCGKTGPLELSESPFHNSKRKFCRFEVVAVLVSAMTECSGI